LLRIGGGYRSSPNVETARALPVSTSCPGSVVAVTRQHWSVAPAASWGISAVVSGPRSTGYAHAW
jgi:hypothetical protein